MRSHVEDYGEVKLDADGNIRLDLPCVECGYNLRGLSASGDCPECGKPKANSYRLRNNSLRWWLLPAVPLAGTSIFLAAANYYFQDWYSVHGWAGHLSILFGTKQECHLHTTCPLACSRSS